jgi:uncharacterized membrane protein YhfC
MAYPTRQTIVYPILYMVNGLLMMAMPIALGQFLAVWRKASWGLFAIGAATFILSQVGHIPFNLVIQPIIGRASAGLSPQGQLIVMALFLGLSAGLFEESARYLTYRYWATDARTWGKGMMLGAGHGGIEAILAGLSVIGNFYILNAIRNGTFNLEGVTADQSALIDQQVQALFAVPWYAIPLGAVERLFAITFHLAASLLVMQSFVRGNGRPGLWLLAAVLLHTFLNAAAVYIAVTWNIYVSEGVLGLLTLISLFIILRLRQPEPAEPPLPEPLPPAGPAEPIVMEVTAESLEKSRYH